MTPPDSGEREVALCGHRDVAWMCTRPPGHFGAHAYWRVRDAAPQVSLPLDLAQRILAALEDSLEGECIALGAELRARLPR